MFGVQDNVTEDSREFALPAGKKDLLSLDVFAGSVETSDRAGPTVMILGDSFTRGHFPPMLLQHVARVIWVDYRTCGFDWATIDKFRPDEVWWMPNERFLTCRPGLRPIGFAG